MVKKSSILFTAIAVSAIVLSSCGKKKPDTSAYADVCAKVVKCDAQFGAIPDAQKHCQNFMAQLEQKFAATVPAITECINNTPCEELSFQACGAENLQQLKGLMNP
jgi:hypothetical protein